MQHPGRTEEEPLKSGAVPHLHPSHSCHFPPPLMTTVLETALQELVSRNARGVPSPGVAASSLPGTVWTGRTENGGTWSLMKSSETRYGYC